MNRTPTFALICLLSAASSAGCDGCGDEAATPTPPTPVAEGSAASTFVPFGADTDAPQGPEVAPTRPTFVHDAPPTAADFAITPVTGAWSQIDGNATRSGTREVRAIETPRVAWSIEVGIQGYSNTPIVLEDGSLYVSSQGNRHNNRDANPEDDRNGVYRLDPSTGAILWHAPTAQDANGMALAGDALVVGTDDGHVLALDRETGAVRWDRDIGCGVTTSPQVVGDQVLVPFSDTLARYSLATGEPIGGVPSAGCRQGERGGVSVDGDDWYVTYNRRPLEFWQGGTLQWGIDAPTEQMGGWDGWHPPIVTSSMLVQQYHRWPFGDPSARGSRRAGVVALWRDNGQLAWTIDVNDPALATDDSRQPTPMLRGQPWLSGDRMLYTPTNRPELVAYSLTDGSVVDTLALPDCRRRQFASIVGTPSMAYFARHDGLLYGVRPNPLAIAWRVSLGMHGAAGLSETHSPVEGAACSHQPTNSTALFSTPAIGADGTLYIGAGDGWVYAVRDESW